MLKDIEKAELMINELSSHYYINIPFELNDEFKQAFPTARFNKFSQKEWSVSLRHKQEFTEWVACKLDAISKYRTAKVKKQLLAGKLQLVENVFDIKHVVKYKYNGLFTSFNGEKGWFVSKEHLSEIINLRDKVSLDKTNAKNRALDSDSFSRLLVKFERAIDSFNVTKNSKITLGYIAQYDGGNDDIRALINDASKIIASIGRQAIVDPGVTTFDDELKQANLEITREHGAYRALETIVYSLMLNLLRSLKEHKHYKMDELIKFKSQQEIIQLIAKHFKF